ncbi:MAG: hypothetical protein KJ065_03065 [Anaerolineae bacterium]|nr:hypothetical protein [Anaerolineae bacterium]
MMHTQHDETPKVHRPYRLIMLSILVALLNVGMVFTSLQLPPELAAQTSLLPALEVAVGVFWAAVFAYAALRLWQRRPNPDRVLAWALTVWIGYSLVRLTVFARADYDRGRLPFLWAAGLVGCVLIGIFLLRPGRTGAAHMETNDDEQRED